jgi:hypothetical protein
MKTDTLKPDLTNNGVSLTSALDSQQLILFDYLKNALLEIFPLQDGVFTEMSLELAENFAIRATDGISVYIENIIQSKLKELTI